MKRGKAMIIQWLKNFVVIFAVIWFTGTAIMDLSEWGLLKRFILGCVGALALCGFFFSPWWDW